MTKQADDELGMAWWNSLTERERAKWSAAAGNTGRAKDAWEAFKKSSSVHQPSSRSDTTACKSVMPVCRGEGCAGAF